MSRKKEPPNVEPAMGSPKPDRSRQLSQIIADPERFAEVPPPDIPELLGQLQRLERTS